MIPRKLPNASASKIAVTGTSASLKSLIDTANGGAANLDPTIDAVLLYVEDGDINVGYDYTPTGSEGFLLKEGGIYYFNKVYFDSLNLIRVGSNNVSCRVQVGETEGQEQVAFAQLAGGSGGGSSSGSGGAASGAGTYSNALGDFTATANSGAKTITITGLPYTLEVKHVVFGSIKQIDSNGLVTNLPLTDVAVSSGVITLDDMSANFAAGDTVAVTLLGPDKAYDKANDANDTGIINGPETQFRGDTLADVTNETNGTNYYYIPMDKVNHLTLQFEKTGGTDSVTMTVEATAQDDGTAAASCTYQDITQYGMTVETAATAASYTTDVITSLKENANFKYIRVKTVSAGGANDADYALYAKRWYS